MKLARKLCSVIVACGMAASAHAGVINYDVDFDTATFEGMSAQNNSDSNYFVQSNGAIRLYSDSWFAIDLEDTFGLSSVNLDDPLTSYTLDFKFRLFQRIGDGGLQGGLPTSLPEIGGLFFADFSAGQTDAIASKSFNLVGTQDWWGLDDFSYTNNRWQSFSIALDDYLSGSFTHIVLINDCDQGCNDVQVRFRDMTLSEVSAPTALSLAVLGLGITGWRRHRRSV